MFVLLQYHDIMKYYEILRLKAERVWDPKGGRYQREQKKNRKKEKHTKTFSTQQNQHTYELTETEAASTGPAWVFTRWYSWAKRIPNPGPISNWRPLTKKT